MIITAKKEVPKRWILFAILPWASFTFNSGVVGVAFLFSLKKFIENPAGLTFVLSLPGLLAILISPVASFLSDRIWTRFGRRKPFIIASWVGMFTAMALMPLAPNFWMLLGAFILYHLSFDLNSPMEPLKQEIIPPGERGWATGAMTWFSNLATMIFYFVMLGRFDDVTFLAGMPLDGESAIYWSASLLLATLLCLIILGIRETNPHSSIRGQRFTLRNFVGGLLDRELWPVYLLVIGNSCLNFYAGLGALSNLLYTDQWGYSKQEMGINVAIGGIINLFVIGILTSFADKLNRMRAYQTVLCLSLLGNILYYCYVEFILPDKRPTLVEIIVFGEVLSILAILSGLLYIPLVYDYVRRNRLGTYAAGASIVTKVTTLITLNGVGLFVSLYAGWFQPPAGEMTRVVLRDEIPETSLIQSLQSGPAWPAPTASDAAANAVTANVWQADGMVASAGRTWEIRRRNPDSETLAQVKKELESERSAKETQRAIARDSAAIKARKGDAAGAADGEREMAAHQGEIDRLAGQIAGLDATLKQRAEQFGREVIESLGGRLLADGDQVMRAERRPAIAVEVGLEQRPDGRRVEKMLDDLRRLDPGLIDLRTEKRGDQFTLIQTSLLPVDESAEAAAVRIDTGLRRAIVRDLPGAVIVPVEHALFAVQTATVLDLQVVEDPVDAHVTPITGMVNAVQAWFGYRHDPLQRLSAAARSLRVKGDGLAVRILPGPEQRSVTVLAVIPTNPEARTPADDAVTKRLQQWPGMDAAALAEVRTFYDRTAEALAVQRVTLARPVLVSGYAPIRYDYMSGYLWMFFMGTIGITLTFVFCKLEGRGIIRKRGVEEANQS